LEITPTTAGAAGYLKRPRAKSLEITPATAAAAGYLERPRAKSLEITPTTAAAAAGYFGKRVKRKKAGEAERLRQQGTLI
jgi:hypothetical protein